MLEAVREHWAAMFAWLGIALVIDALDGPIARRLDVVRLQPNWSGEVLDLVVDFVTYVFVPAYAITASGLLLPLAAPLLGIGIVVSGALYFADRRMKTDGQSFSRLSGAVECRGVLSVPAASAAGACRASVVAILIVLTFVPFHVLHPVRVARLRGLTLSLIGALGGACDLSRWPAISTSAPPSPSRSVRSPLYIVGKRCGDPAVEIASAHDRVVTSPEAWAALLTLTALEIVLGIDNVIFLSVIVSRIPPQQAKRARQIGLALALVFRILLLSLLVWLIGLTAGRVHGRRHRAFPGATSS